MEWSSPRHFVPPVQGYEAPTSLRVTVQGQTYDVLSYDPEEARDLLAQAGFPHGKTRDGHTLNIEVLLTTYPYSRPIAEILQQQWRKNLNISVTLVTQEMSAWVQTLLNQYYNGVSESNWAGSPTDPNAFLENYVSGSGNNDTGWTDVRYDAMLAEANATNDPAMRLKKLADCENYLLKGMPFVPLVFSTLPYLEKPYVRGLARNMVDEPILKYTWIDTDWKPEASHEQISRK
jgi:oligopeptide transport system substrate-binding protein